MVSAITPKRCSDYETWRGSPSMARNDLLTLQAALNFAHANRKLLHKIAVSKPKPPKKRVRWLTRSEAAALLLGALGWDRNGKRHRDKINYPLARFIVTGYHTGTRKDRILCLQWVESLSSGWIDLDRGVLHRKGGAEPETKKRAPSVPLGDRLWAHMKRWRKLSARFLIEHNGAPAGDVARAWKTACELAGLDRPVKDPQRITPHVLRHTCCSWLLQAGLSEWKVGEYVGMTAALVASTYGHNSDDVQRETRAPQDEASKASPRAPRRLVRSPVFSCFLQIQDLPSPLLTITLPRFRGAYCARALHPCFATPERGVAERREVRTYSSSRLRGATTALAKRGVPLRPGRRPSALHRGDFRPRDYASSPAGAAAGSASRRARGRTMRSGRVPCLPRRGSRRSLGTPRPAPRRFLTRG
jgi:integrase